MACILSTTLQAASLFICKVFRSDLSLDSMSSWCWTLKTSISQQISEAWKLSRLCIPALNERNEYDIPKARRQASTFLHHMRHILTGWFLFNLSYMPAGGKFNVGLCCMSMDNNVYRQTLVDIDRGWWTPRYVTWQQRLKYDTAISIVLVIVFHWKSALSLSCPMSSNGFQWLSPDILGLSSPLMLSDMVRWISNSTPGK